MAIIDTQRSAIETLVELAGTSHINLRSIDDWTLELDGEPIVFCGVSQGQGPQSRSDAKVAVFSFGEPDHSRPLPSQKCDAAVLLRSPTQSERARWGSNTALHSLDAIKIEATDRGVRVSKLGHSAQYVPL